MMMAQFDTNKDAKISWDEFVQALERIKEYVDETAKKSAMYKSHEQYFYDRMQHKRIGVPPEVTCKFPMTSGQQYGFKVAQENSKDFYHHATNYPKNRCDETKYAEVMLKTGFQGCS
eukprot:TRINITY_DN675_c0_g1_i5.p2 TRINITY_DN675_c0_g1~~TRINITY_DN675_c0_g1_i5.p2  ORF type:complete len:117 (+),score=38.43 TRINITY_DN675_c0_g1_i5:420-770(+)